MESIPWHAALVHVPLGLAVAAPLLLAGMTLALGLGRLARGAWWFAVALQALLLVGGLVAMKAGEREEERIEQIVAERHIEAHEERAEAFVWAVGVTLALCIAVLVVREPLVSAAALASVAALATLALAVRTGESGGELVYKYGAASAYAEPATGIANE